MIAVCPSCHDAIHHGKLPIDDETLYRWKGIVRPTGEDRAFIYVEPAPKLKLLAGGLALSTTNDRAIIFNLSSRNALSIDVLDGDVLQVSNSLKDVTGREVFRVVKNNIRVVRSPDIVFDFSPGHCRVTVPETSNYIPQWAIDKMRVHEPDYALEGRVTALELEVLKPGLVRVEGIWVAEKVTIIITRSSLSFCRPELARPISLQGEGEESEISFAGDVHAAMFEVR